MFPCCTHSLRTVEVIVKDIKHDNSQQHLQSVHIILYFTVCYYYTPCFNKVEGGGGGGGGGVSNLRKCAMCNVCFKIQKSEILANSLNL